jgi:hypothetical protein
MEINDTLRSGKSCEGATENVGCVAAKQRGVVGELC